jgi:Adenine-specific methyltransferase EcoRI
MANSNLTSAKKAKNDEFYTQYSDIEKEINAYLEFDPDVFKNKTILLPCDDPEWSNFTKYFAQNFQRFGIKKLISTSYAHNSKNYDGEYQPSLFETQDSQFDENKTANNGKIFTLTADKNKNGVINFEDLEWHYLEGSGDFRSEEIKKLRDEADIIITNPPFSLFRDFLAWIVEGKSNNNEQIINNNETVTKNSPLEGWTPKADGVDFKPKKFLIIGNMNAITYKEVFPLIKENKLWLGPSITSGDREFEVPKDVVDMDKFTGEMREGKYFQRVMGVRWFTNIDHGRRHQPLSLMTMGDNIKFSKHKEIKGIGYQKYDNYEAIEIPFTDSIPSDYKGVMGVPISFLDKYSPDQFEIKGIDRYVEDNPNYGRRFTINGNEIYARILIRFRGGKLR